MSFENQIKQWVLVDNQLKTLNDKMKQEFNFTPIPKKYITPYETQAWFYNTPSCTYSQFPTKQSFFAPPQQTNVFYYLPEKSSSTYFAYPNAYPSFPYTPCVFPNTSI